MPTNYQKSIGEGFSAGQIGAGLNFNRDDRYGGQKIGGLYIDGTVLPGRSVQGTHEVSTTQNYKIGERRVTEDGRVFRYALSSGACTAGRGNVCSGTMGDNGIATNAVSAQVVGATKIDFASQSFEVDELKGGYLVVHTTAVQNRHIIGNSYASSSTVVINIEEPFTSAFDAAQYAEVCPNPYRYIMAPAGAVSAGWAGVMGVPFVSVAASGSYFWLQTWGMCWLNPGPYGYGGEYGQRDMLFNPDGSLRNMSAWGVISDYQKAGFIVHLDTAAGDGPPFCMLQISP